MHFIGFFHHLLFYVGLSPCRLYQDSQDTLHMHTKIWPGFFQTFCAAAGNSHKHSDASRLFAYAISRCVTTTFHYTFSRSLSAYYDSITKAYGTLCRHLLKRSYIQGTNWACLVVHVPSNVSRPFQETISFPTYAFPMISRHVMIKLYIDLLTIVK